MIGVGVAGVLAVTMSTPIAGDCTLIPRALAVFGLLGLIVLVAFLLLEVHRGLTGVERRFALRRVVARFTGLARFSRFARLIVERMEDAMLVIVTLEMIDRPVVFVVTKMYVTFFNSWCCRCGCCRRRRYIRTAIGDRVELRDVPTARANESTARTAGRGSVTQTDHGSVSPFRLNSNFPCKDQTLICLNAEQLREFRGVVALAGRESGTGLCVGGLHVPAGRPAGLLRA